MVDVQVFNSFTVRPLQAFVSSLVDDLPEDLLAHRRIFDFDVVQVNDVWTKPGFEQHVVHKEEVVVLLLDEVRARVKLFVVHFSDAPGCARVVGVVVDTVVLPFSEELPTLPRGYTHLHIIIEG